MTSLGFLRRNARWLLAGFLLTFSSSFGQTFFISVFAGEIQAEFGLSHGAWGSIYMVGTLASAVVMVWAGSLTDHFRVRRLGTLTLLILALACVSAALVPNAWFLPLAVFLLRVAGQGMASHTAAVAMARWFSAARGRALAIAAFGFSVGEAILPFLAVLVMGAVGWRISWLFAAVLALAIIPILLMLLVSERTPQSMAEESEATGMAQRHWSRQDVLRNRVFWLLFPTLLGPSAFGTAFFFHQVHLAETKGWSHLDMVSLFPVYTGTAVIAMVVSGFAIDRFGSARLMPVLLLPMAFGFALFGGSEAYVMAALSVAGYGITTGMNSTLSSAFWAELYGTRHLGSIKAMATAVMVLGSAIGPGLTGIIIDAGVSYDRQMIWVALYMLVSAALALAATRSRSHFG
ncbi:MAG: MFS transporter [Pseudomonadota bacterium]